MKAFLRKLFRPLLNVFERGDEIFIYKKSHRTILAVVGVLFMALTAALLAYGARYEQIGVLIPVTVFLAVSITCLVVSFLGTDRAVAKIWGNK